MSDKLPRFPQSPKFVTYDELARGNVLIQAKRETIMLDVDRLKNRIRDFLEKYTPMSSWVSMLSGFISTLVAWLTADVHVIFENFLLVVCSIFAFLLVVNAKKCWKSKDMNADTLLDMLRSDCSVAPSHSDNKETSSQGTASLVNSIFSFRKSSAPSS